MMTGKVIQFKVDPTSKEFQTTTEYLPDKTESWPFPPEEDGWVHAHNGLRGEMQMMRDALEAVDARRSPIREWEIKQLAKALKVHLTHIHVHHTVEDEIFTPAYKQRFRYPDKVSQLAWNPPSMSPSNQNLKPFHFQLADDHIGLEAKLKSIETTFASLNPGDSVSDALAEWVQYQEFMLPHLAEEEEVGLPLMRAYFTPDDVKPLIMKTIKAYPQDGGGFIYFCGVDKFYKEFMVQEGIPWFVWYIDFRFQFKAFKKAYVDPLERVKAGKEPRSFFGWLK
jgi:hypothetical protein